MKNKITVIDLNNFSYYPTLAIGYLISFLRKAAFDVTLLSPLNKGIAAPKRERIENVSHYWKALVVNSDRVVIKKMMMLARKLPFVYNFFRSKDQIFESLKNEVPPGTDLVLISTYFENYYICRKLCRFLKMKGIPVIIGGPGFNNKTVTREWLGLEGVDAIVGSEVDHYLADLVRDYLDGKEITHYPGVFTKQQRDPDTSYIFKALDTLPVPDFTDFPWDKYPMRIVPYMTGRGCGWGKCNFCTDVLYVNGRTFRSMASQKVLSDLKELSRINKTNLIYFSDIKLNSNLEVWNSLINHLPEYVQDPRWFGTVHVDNKVNGLDRESLFKAKTAGLMRLSFGFESGSQKLLDHMRKGTRIEKIERFLNDVHDAGISLRATMFVGYPYEDEEDLRLTYEFLKKNAHCFDRISLSKFQLFEMAPLYPQVMHDFGKVETIHAKFNHNIFTLSKRGKKYSYYKHKVLRQVNAINSKPLLKDAIPYDGIM
ncbi:MAG TPA: radical SAM protein [Ohtaekwangia sp.]|nr:radical SAM protein [Ohtaekwangia sp.]